MELSDLIAQVKTNCNISDARFWGYYSICGLLLRMRDLCRSERHIPEGEEMPQDVIGPWIAEREGLWKELEESDYLPLAIESDVYPPFETDAINRVLMPRGLLYGAGLGIYMKPSFFLADLVSSRRYGPYEALVAGTEHARDLSAHPAMLRDGTIYARREALAGIIRSRFAEALHKRFDGALGYAFASYGVGPDGPASGLTHQAVEDIVDGEIETFIRHEIGEAAEGKRLGEEWKTLLAGAGDRRAEAFYRGLKDVLADTSDSGMLRYIIEGRRRGSLGFYRSYLGGYAILIFPEIRDAFAAIRERDDWGAVEMARQAGYARAAGLADRVLEIHASAGKDAGALVERELIGPLQATA